MTAVAYLSRADWLILTVLCCLCHAAIVVGVGAFKRIGSGAQP